MTSGPKPGNRIVGSLRRIDDVTGSIRMEDIFDTGAEDLWSALTEPLRLARWIAKVEGDLRPGGRVHAWFTSSSGGPGRIDVCDPPRRLLVTLDPGTSEETIIEAVLTPVGEQTRLMIEQRGIPLAELAAHGAGWQAHVEDLAAYLSGRQPGVWRARWIELTPAYEQLPIVSR
jgi:uncharacterized protein YndB with AHSA1/START domain